MSNSSSAPSPEFSINELNTRILNIDLSGETLDLGTRAYKDFVGANSTLTDCRIHLHNSEAIIFSKVTFRSCHFVVLGKRFKDAQWRNVSLENCSFEGIFRFWSVGPDYFDRSFPMQIKDCDFTQARLEFCTFSNIDWSSCKRPSYPHIVFHEAHRYKSEIQSLSSDIYVSGFLNLATFYDVEVVAFSLDFLREPEQRYSEGELQKLFLACRSMPCIEMNF